MHARRHECVVVIELLCLQKSSLSEEHSDQFGLWSDSLCCLPGKIQSHITLHSLTPRLLVFV